MDETSRPLSRAERKKLELRQEIIDAAFDCFAERGYHGTGIADIAQRLGIGHGTFYRYFDNKRDIIEHVIDDVLHRIRAQLTDQNAPEAVSDIDEYRTQTRRIATALTEVLLADERIPKLVLFEATSVDPQMTQRVLRFLDETAELTAAYFRHGVDSGYLRADLDVDSAARAVNGMMLGVVFHAAAGAAEASIDALEVAVQSLMFDGIVRRDGSA